MLHSHSLNAKHVPFFQVFGRTRPGIEPRPAAYKASILPLPVCAKCDSALVDTKGKSKDHL